MMGSQLTANLKKIKSNMKVPRELGLREAPLPLVGVCLASLKSMQILRNSLMQSVKLKDMS
jgi:hypothetical protein